MFKRKKQSPIERRLELLEKEMSGLNRDLKNVVRSAVPPPAQAKIENAGMAKQAAPARVADLGKKSELPEGELFDYAANKPEMAGQEQELFSDLPSRNLLDKQATSAGTVNQSNSEKFAPYFLAGHFPALRPTRQESRSLRKRAILILILAALVIWWIINRFTH